MPALAAIAASPSPARTVMVPSAFVCYSELLEEVDSASELDALTELLDDVEETSSTLGAEESWKSFKAAVRSLPPDDR